MRSGKGGEAVRCGEKARTCFSQSFCNNKPGSAWGKIDTCRIIISSCVNKTTAPANVSNPMNSSSVSEAGFGGFPLIVRFNYRVRQHEGDQAYKNHDLESFAGHTKELIVQRNHAGCKLLRYMPRTHGS